eukprot:CAMPEP_0194327740 /NCGR_PEP_ID=MMETSP0171-20130528/42273_1 /TAXON_ID=218684 /ORGANISM="Corethron pennatum, Strain L29A3" /LENGTH=86 /DNA_ID=CAMNT_0039087783 /DNA_START=71 /DNA_END=328 /DNA_ORIENTATION=+
MTGTEKSAHDVLCAAYRHSFSPAHDSSSVALRAAASAAAAAPSSVVGQLSLALDHILAASWAAASACAAPPYRAAAAPAHTTVSAR